MILYKCLISDDEMFTDAYPCEEKDGFYILKGKLVTKKADDVDESLIGGNPSAEGDGDEGTVEGDMVTGVNVILDMRLQSTGFGSKKDYKTYMSTYMKTVVSKLKERGTADDVVDAAKQDAIKAFNAALANFKEWEFYMGESNNPDAHVALVDWKDEEEDGKQVSVPYVYFYKAGLLAEKC